MARGDHRRGLVGHQHVDDAVGRLHRRRPHRIGVDTPQAAAFDHRRPAHADAGGLRRDHHVAAAQQRRVAGEAAPVHDAHQRHLPRQRGQAREAGAVQARHAQPVDIARPAAAAFGEQHQRQLLRRGQRQQAVGLGVVEDALRAGEHGVVVGHHRHRPAADQAGAGDEPVGRCVALQVVEAAAAALRRHRERAVLGEAAGVEQVVDVLARTAPACCVAPCHRFGPRGVERARVAVQHGLQRGTRHGGVGGRDWRSGRGRGRGCRHGAGLEAQQRRAFGQHLAHRREDAAHDAGTRCLQRHFHLHGFLHHQGLPRGHGLSGHDLDADHRAVHRGRQHPRRAAVVVCCHRAGLLGRDCRGGASVAASRGRRSICAAGRGPARRHTSLPMPSHWTLAS